MAYINEKVPRNKSRRFELPPYGTKVIRVKWTIDKEKNAILFKYMDNRDKLEEEYFYFFTKVKRLA